MDSTKRRWSPERVVAIAALAFGVAAGSYGIADAANGSGSGSGQSSSALSGSAAPAAASTPKGQPWGHQRSDETPLSGDALQKVTAAAKAKEPGATIVRVETDADGHAAYEAHLVKSDGTPVTVYVNKQFEVVSVESGMPGPPGGQAPPSSSGASA
jgi:hypothetical protein